MATFTVNGQTVTTEKKQKLLRFLLLRGLSHHSLDLHCQILLGHAHPPGKPGLAPHVETHAAVLRLVQIDDISHLQTVNIVQVQLYLRQLRCDGKLRIPDVLQDNVLIILVLMSI